MLKHFIFLLILFANMITNLTANDLKVIYPNGTEKILGGSEITLKWENPNSLYPLNLYYSIDNAKNWFLIDKDIYQNEYKWKAPRITSNKCLFKVEAITNGKDYTTFPSGHSARMCAVCYSPDGKYIATGSDDNNVYIFEVASQKKIATCLGHTGTVEFLDWSPDSKKLASVGSDNNLIIWDTGDWKLLKSIFAPNGGLYYVEWDNKSKNVAVTGKNALLYVFDGNTGSKIIQVNTGHSDLNSTLCWSSDDSFLVVGSWDANFSIWETKNYTQLMKINNNNRLIADIDLSFDDRYIATATRDGIVTIYDLLNNRFLSDLKQHQGKHGTVVYWNYDNYQLATSSYDGKVCIWDMNLNKIIKDYQINGEEVYELDWDRTNGCLVAVGLTRNVNIICDTEAETYSDISDNVWEIYELNEKDNILPEFSVSLICDEQRQYIKLFNKYIDPLIINLTKSTFKGDNVFRIDTNVSTITVPISEYALIPIAFQSKTVGDFNSELTLVTNYSNFTFDLSASTTKIIPDAYKQQIEVVLDTVNIFYIAANIQSSQKAFINNIKIRLKQNHDCIHFEPNSIVSYVYGVNWKAKLEFEPPNNYENILFEGNGKLEIPFNDTLFSIKSKSFLDTNQLANLQIEIDYGCLQEEYPFAELYKKKYCNQNLFEIKFIEKEYGIDSLYPNPNKGNFYLKYIIPFDNLKCEIVITDLTGITVYQHSLADRKAGKYRSIIKVPNLSNGKYILILKLGSYIDTRQMIIEN